MADQKHFAMEYPKDSGVVVVFDTHGSSNPDDWTLAGVGELDNQTWEQFAEDFAKNEGHLDDFRNANNEPADGENLGGGGENQGEDPVPPEEDKGGEGEGKGGGEGEGKEGGEGEGAGEGKGGGGEGENEDSKPGPEELLEELADLEGELSEIQDQVGELGEEIENLQEELEAGAEGGGEEGPGPGDFGKAAESTGQALEKLEGIAEGVGEEGSDAGSEIPLEGPPGGEGTVDLPPGPAAEGGDPVSLYNGAFSRAEVDLRAEGPGFDFVFSRTYCNQLYAIGALGPKWRHCFEDEVRELESRRLLRTTGDGTTLVYEPTANGWEPPPGVAERVERDGTGWRISDGFGIVHRFSVAGRLTEIADRFGNRLALTWAGNRLQRVDDPAGRSWTFAYGANGLLASVQAPDGGSVRFGYATGRLTSVALPDPGGGAPGPAYSYGYRDGADPRLLHNLTRMRESGSGVDLLTNSYGEEDERFNRVVAQDYEGGTFEYEYAPRADGGGVTTVTGLDNTVVEHDFDADGRLRERRVRTRGVQPGAPARYVTKFEYADNGLPSRVTSPGGGVTEFTWDDSDPLRQTNLLIQRRRPRLGAPASQSVTESYVYGPFNQVRQVRAADNTVTSMQLDPNGLVERIELPAVPIAGGAQRSPVFEQDWRPDGQEAERRDPNGLRTVNQYFSDPGRRGLLSRIEQRAGSRVRAQVFERDSMGRVTGLTLPGGRHFTWQLDSRGRPTSMRRDDDLMRTWRYDRFDRVLEVRTRRTEPDGKPSKPEWVATVFVYDAYGRLTESRVEAEGSVLQRLRYGYRPGGDLVSLESPGGRIERTTYDERGLIVEHEAAAGTAEATRTRYFYDPDGNLERLVDPRGNAWRREYDGLGRAVGFLDPTGCRDEVDVDACGRPVQLRRRDPAGVLRMRVDLARNLHGRVVSRRSATLSATGAVQGWLEEREDVDLEGNPVRLHLPGGKVMNIEYDLFGQPTRQVDPAGNEVRLAYDENGNQTRMTRVERLGPGSTLTLEREVAYDHDGRPVRSTDSAGNEERMSYDSDGQLRAATLLDGSRIACSYDPLGRLVESRTIGPGGRSWTETLAYDAEGLLLEAVDAGGHRRRFSYDVHGRMVTAKDGRGTVRARLAYDAAGAITRITDARGVETAQTFDPLGRVVERTVTAPASVPGARKEKFAYDALGNPTRAENENATVTHAYDSLGLLREASVDGLKIKNEYADGARTKTTYPSGLRLAASRDELGRLTGLRAETAAAGIASGPIAAWKWQGRGLPAERTTPGGVKASWRHDPLGRPLLLEVSGSGGNSLYRELELRDSIDRVVVREQAGPGGRAVRATYDARGQLTELAPVDSLGNLGSVAAALGPGKTQADVDARAGSTTRTSAPALKFSYDDDGNRLQRKEGSAKVDYAYDAAERMTKAGAVNLGWDAAGNLIDDGTNRYAYDFAGRLAEVKRKAGGAVVYSCRYDALGRPASIRVDGRDLRVVHDSGRPIELRDAAGALDTLLVWGAREGELVTHSHDGTVSHGVGNLHGDLALLTTPQGAAAERYSYGAFGERRIMSPGGAARQASALENPFGYLGRPHVTGDLVDLRARHLHSGWGRFTTADPAGGLDGMNPYLYARNDPLSQADHDGQSATAVGAALGFALGAGWAIGSMANAGIHAAWGPDWGEPWQGFAHYGSQVAQFTASGAMIGAGVDLAPVAGGMASAALMGGGMTGLVASAKGDWGNFANDVAIGGATGVAVWGVGKVAAPVLGPVATGLAGTALGRGVISLGQGLGGTAMGQGTVAAFNVARNWLGRQAERTWGNAIVSRITGPILRNHLSQALGGQGVAQGDLALMNRMVAETFERLQTSATTWGGFRRAFWKAARQTNAFNQLFPNATGTGAPIYGNLGRLNIHHLAGRVRDLVFAESNLMLVPNALDTPFAHSAAYLTGTQQWAIRRGLRALFPRQWTSGMLGAAAAELDLLNEGAEGAAVC